MLIAIIMIAVSLGEYFEKEKYKHDIIRLEEELRKKQKQIDSLEQEYQYIIIHYTTLNANYQRALKKYNDLENKYRAAKSNKTPVLSDPAYDSILNRLYPR